MRRSCLCANWVSSGGTGVRSSALKTAGRAKSDLALVSVVDAPLSGDGTSRKSTISITGSLIIRCRLETGLFHGAFSGSARSDDGLDVVEEIAGLGLVPCLGADSNPGFGSGLSGSGPSGFGGATVFSGIVAFRRPLSAAWAVALAIHWGLTGSNTNSGLRALDVANEFPDRNGQVRIVASRRASPPVGAVAGIGFVFNSSFGLAVGVASRCTSRLVNSAAARRSTGIGFVFNSSFALAVGVASTGTIGLSLTTVFSGAILGVGSDGFRCDACLFGSNRKDSDARSPIIENDDPCLPAGFTESVLATEECAFACGGKAAGFDIGTVMVSLADGGWGGGSAGSILLASTASTGFRAGAGSSSDNTILFGATADSANGLSKCVNEGDGELKPPNAFPRGVSTGISFPIVVFKTIPVVVSGFASVPRGLMVTFSTFVGTLSGFGATSSDETQISALAGSTNGVFGLISRKFNVVAAEDLLGDVDIDSGSSA